MPDDALVVRGGVNAPENFTKGAEVLTDAAGLLSGVSVQCAPGKTEWELSRPLMNGKIGVTTLRESEKQGVKLILTQ